MKKEPWENTIELIQSLIGDSYEIKRLYTREYGSATIEKQERNWTSEDGKEHVYRGECEGLIHDKMVGTNGFGYDPIFYYPEFKTTLANVSEEKKNSVSHRGVALEKFLKDWSK